MLDKELKAICRRDFQQSPEYSHCKKLLSEIISGCQAEESTLWLLSEKLDALLGTVNIGKTPETLENIEVLIKDSVIGMVASTGSASCISDDDDYDKSVDNATQSDTRAMAATPVYVSGEICGVLSVLNPLQRDSFDQNDLSLLQWKAYLLGLILQNFIHYN